MTTADGATRKTGRPLRRDGSRTNTICTCNRLDARKTHLLTRTKSDSRTNIAFQILQINYGHPFTGLLLGASLAGS